MGFFELFIVGVGLSMDAFAVSVCKGLSLEKCSFKKALIAGLYFGAFQAIMPMLGYYLGSTFAEYLSSFDHWIAFGLLVIIGAKMMKEAFDKDACNNASGSFKTGDMLLSAVATSIDALAVGVSFSFLQVEILPAAAIIGITTMLISMLGIKIGSLFGTKLKARAELLGGVILVLIGIKILLEHLGIIPL